MSYEEEIQNISNFGIKGLIELSKAKCGDSPWRDLEHGTRILETDVECWSYIAAYWEMHEVRCRWALENFPFKDLASAEIIDWGCGQGLATLCFIKMIKERGDLSAIEKITLIEPSSIALQRARNNVEKIVGSDVEIVTVNQYLPSIEDNNRAISSINISKAQTIHLFSNILDISTINLRELAELISSTEHNIYVICAGPMNSGETRIDEFCSYFRTASYFSDIESKFFSHTSDTNRLFTCKTKSFIIGTIDTRYEDYRLSRVFKSSNADLLFLNAKTITTKKTGEDLLVIEPQVEYGDRIISLKPMFSRNTLTEADKERLAKFQAVDAIVRIGTYVDADGEVKTCSAKVIALLDSNKQVFVPTGGWRRRT